MPSTLGIVASHRSVPAWTPAELSLVEWFSIRDAATVEHSGGVVSRLHDKSGNGYDYVAADVGGPIYGTRTINGHDALDFPTGTGGLYAEAGLNIAPPWTIAAVIDFDDVTTVLNSAPFRYNSAGSRRPISSGATPTRWSVSIVTSQLSVILSSPGVHVFVATLSAGGDLSLRVDAVEVIAKTGEVGSSATIHQQHGMATRNAVAASEFDGGIGELLIASMVAAGDDLANLEAYLAGVAGI